MSFESELYQSMCEVYPAMTVRAFSVIMGKSEGYWSSIKAQGLMASTDSLVNLYDAISAKKILIEQSSGAHQRLMAIQDMIRIELTDRFLIRRDLLHQHKQSMTQRHFMAQCHSLTRPTKLDSWGHRSKPHPLDLLCHIDRIYRNLRVCISVNSKNFVGKSLTYFSYSGEVENHCFKPIKSCN